MATIYSDGFQEWLEQAVRIDDENTTANDSNNSSSKDWSVRMIDYVKFKKRLRYFARRRLQLRNMIRNNPDKKISEQVLLDMVGNSCRPAPQQRRYVSGVTATTTTRNKGDTSGGQEPLSEALDGVHDETEAYYVQFIEPSTSVDEESDNSNGGPNNNNAIEPSLNTVSSGEEDRGGMTSNMQKTKKKRKKHGKQKKLRRVDRRSVMRRLSVSERNEIILFLGTEMDKVLMFYLSQWQQLSARLDEINERDLMIHHVNTIVTNQRDQQQRQQQTNPSSSEQQTQSQEQEQQQRSNSCSPTHDQRSIGNEIIELIALCVMNVIIVQQILLRYDAFARQYEGTPLYTYYMKQILSRKQNAFRKILQHEELNGIAESYIANLLSHAQSINSTQSSTATITTEIFVNNFHSMQFFLHDILSSLPSSSSTGAGATPMILIASTTSSSNTKQWIHTAMYNVRKWFLAGLFEDRLGLEPAYLTMRDDYSLTRQMQQLAHWRHTKVDILVVGITQSNSRGSLSDDDDDHHHNVAKKNKNKKQLTGIQLYHLMLNLLSAFLYCMNYYIVEPSSTLYVNRLGAYDAMSGTLIGMMPLAAFISAIPYSMWTNRSFRYPFIISPFLLIIGNVVYSLADKLQMGLKVALMGRFLCGLGAPKCIIRRYMADTTPVSLRTSVNAGFGMVVAAGSAMGPAMAIVLNRFEFDITAPIGNGNTLAISMNGLTLPGYFMASLWLVFFLIVLFTFEEPDRHGLREQQALERKSAIMGSPSICSTIQQPSEDGASINGNSSSSILHAYSGESANSSGIQSIGQGSLLAGVDNTCMRGTPYEDRGMIGKWLYDTHKFLDMITLPVRICLALLFAKVFTIEVLVSATSALSKNRYRWHVQQVGALGFLNGVLVIPFSILIGRLSLTYQDHVLMKWLVGAGCFGMFLLIDLSDLVATPTATFNRKHILAVNPTRYIGGYFISYLSIQAFEGVIGSALSKVIPTALATGTFNSGLLATLVDTFGRTCGDLFISVAGYISLRQLMNLLFIPGFFIMLTCLVVIERCRDLLSV